MKRYFGVDPSLTCTGLAVVGDFTPMTHFIKTTKAQPKLQRMRRIALAVHGFCDFGTAEEDGGVWIEGLSFASQGSATRDLGGLWWMIAHEVEAPFTSYTSPRMTKVSPSTIKLWATGDGGHKGTSKERKQEVRTAIARLWGIPEPGTFDESDALVAASIGMHYDGALPWEPEPYQVRALETILAATDG